MKIDPKRPIPKKILAALDRLKITGVVGGYTTKIPEADIWARIRGESRAAYTCWDSDGVVVCVLAKGRGDSEWQKIS